MSSFRFGATDLALSWRPFLHESVLALDFPPVPQIDCSQCWMADAGLLHRKVKCCSQFPALPNFLIGELLTDNPDTEGARRVKIWLAQRWGGPLQLHTPPDIAAQYEKLYEDITEKPGCPLLTDEGFCTIYEHRPPLCLGYHCLYPPNNPYMMAFWNTLASLLQLHIAIVSPFLVQALGFDIGRFQNFWQHISLAELWQGEGFQASIREQHAEALWQDRSPEEFYRACYQYIKEHKDTIREDLIAFRQEQLLIFLTNLGQLTPEREAEIREQASEPSLQRPPAQAYHTLKRHHLLYFEENLWTIPELESYLLWFHQQAFGT